MSRFQRHMMKASGNRINFAGKFADDSTPDDWWWKPNGVKESIAEYVDLETKEFAFHWEGELTSLYNGFTSSKISELYLLPNTKHLTEFRYVFNKSDLTYFDMPLDLSSISSMAGCFEDCKNLQYVDFSNVKTSSRLTSLALMFSRSSCKYIDLRSIDMRYVNDIYRTFYFCSWNILLIDNFGAGEVTKSDTTFRRDDFKDSPDTHDALVYTFIEHSFDRKAAGMADFVFTKAYTPFWSSFTEEEVEALNDKGYIYE